MGAVYGANITDMDGVAQLQSVSEDANGDLAFTEGSDRSLTDGQTLTLQGNMGFELGDNVRDKSWPPVHHQLANRREQKSVLQFARRRNSEVQPEGRDNRVAWQRHSVLQWHGRFTRRQHRFGNCTGRTVDARHLHL